METAEVSKRPKEEIAMNKVTYPYSDPYPFIHKTYPKLLDSILKSGIVAGQFAERAKIEGYHSNFNSSWNNRYVSLHRGPLDFHLSSISVGIIVAPYDKPVKATRNIKRDSDLFEPYNTYEYLVKNRISPREIAGIIIGTWGMQEEWWKFEEAMPLDNVLEIMKRRGIYVPVYRISLSGIREIDGLIWPQKMSRVQLREYLK